MTNTRTEHERDLALEDFAAALTEAVYPVVLWQRPKCSWLDLELNLWKVLGQTIQAMTDANPLLKLIESNPQTRPEWIAALDTIEALKPRAVIAGPKKPENDDSPRIIEETRQYIHDFDRVAKTSTTARELYDKMLELYPDRVNPGALWLSARAVKP